MVVGQKQLNCRLGGVGKKIKFSNFTHYIIINNLLDEELDRVGMKKGIAYCKQGVKADKDICNICRKK